MASREMLAMAKRALGVDEVPKRLEEMLEKLQECSRRVYGTENMRYDVAFPLIVMLPFLGEATVNTQSDPTQEIARKPSRPKKEQPSA